MEKTHLNEQKPRTLKNSDKNNHSKKYGNTDQFTFWKYAASLQHFRGKSVYRCLKKITEDYKIIFICIFYA